MYLQASDVAISEPSTDEECSVVPPTPVPAESSSQAAGQDLDWAPSETESTSEFEYPNEEAYFIEPNPSTERHTWLVAFFKYLETPAAGFHQAKNKLQHACQVSILHRSIFFFFSVPNYLVSFIASHIKNVSLSIPG